MNLTDRIHKAVQQAGAELISVTASEVANRVNAGVVLARREGGRGTEFVCWLYNDDSGSLDWGHYGDIALDKYRERVVVFIENLT